MYFVQLKYYIYIYIYIHKLCYVVLEQNISSKFDPIFSRCWAHRLLNELDFSGKYIKVII